MPGHFTLVMTPAQSHSVWQGEPTDGAHPRRPITSSITVGYSRAVSLSADELARRKPLWSAMSDLFLDTETRWSVPYVGHACVKSGFDDATLERAFWAEMFPLALFNLHDIAGEWAMLEISEELLAERAEKGERDRALELTDAWMVKYTWDASMMLCRRLRTEPEARWQPLTNAWHLLGKRFLEDVGRKLLSDPTKQLAEGRAAGIDWQAEWAFYRPVLADELFEGERKELEARIAEVEAMLGG